MARRRSRATRIQDLGRKRRTRRPPGPGWTIAELEQLSGVTRRTIADYVRRGLLSAPEFRGTATRYQRHHLLRLLAVRLLRRDGVSRLARIFRQLQAMGDQQVESFVLSRPLPTATLRALGATQPSTNPSGKPPATSTATEAAPVAETWQRAVLMPGLELTWRREAGPLVERLAQRFTAQLKELADELLSDHAS